MPWLVYSGLALIYKAVEILKTRHLKDLVDYDYMSGVGSNAFVGDIFWGEVGGGCGGDVAESCNLYSVGDKH